MFLSGFPFAMTDADIRARLAAHGEVVEVRLARDGRSGRSKGFGFVAMSSAGDVERAVAAENGADWGGRPVKVERARSVR